MGDAASTRSPLATLTVRLGGVLVPVLLGATAVGIAAQVAAFSKRRWVLALALAGIMAGAFATRRPKQVFFAGFVFALTYNRQYFVHAFAPEGAQGLYWVPADLFLAALLATVALERVVQGPRGAVRARSFLPWLAPFAIAALLSTLGAIRVDWGVYELVRIARLGLVLLLVHRAVERDEWWTVVVALGAAISAQGALGTLQFVTQTQSSGALAILGLGEELAADLPAQDQSAAAGLLRAKGTLVHPNILGTYFELVVPMLRPGAALPRGIGNTSRSAPPRRAGQYGRDARGCRGSWCRAARRRRARPHASATCVAARDRRVLVCALGWRRSSFATRSWGVTRTSPGSFEVRGS
jgi:hypothetical protein